MPTTFELYNSTAIDILIDDIPVSVTVPPRQGVAIPGGNTPQDVMGSFKIRNFVISGQLGLIVNGRSVDYRRILRSQASA